MCDPSGGDQIVAAKERALGQQRDRIAALGREHIDHRLFARAHQLEHESPVGMPAGPRDRFEGTEVQDPRLTGAGRHDRHLGRRLARNDQGLAAVGRERQAGSIGDANGLGVVRRPDVDRAMGSAAVPALIEQHGVSGRERGHTAAFAPRSIDRRRSVAIDEFDSGQNVIDRSKHVTVRRDVMQSQRPRRAVNDAPAAFQIEAEDGRLPAAGLGGRIPDLV